MLLTTYGELEKLKARLLRQALNEVTDTALKDSPPSGQRSRGARLANALPIARVSDFVRGKAGNALAQMHLQISLCSRARLIFTCRRNSYLIQMRND